MGCRATSGAVLRKAPLTACAMHRLLMLGTAVGSSAARMAEAVRRKLVGRDRVALAFELTDGGLDESLDAGS